MQRGKAAEGIRLLTTGLTQYRATGSRLLLPYFLSFLADAHGQQGKAEGGLKIIDEAVHLTETTFDRFWAAEVYRIKGQLTLQSQTSLRQVKASQNKSRTSQKKAETPQSQILNPKSQAEAEACFHRAIEIARQQEAKSLELRAVMSLARLWQSQGKITDARHQLAEIHGWFTEGFDTKDLREAKALLDELA